jgi:hypothetical protein
MAPLRNHYVVEIMDRAKPYQKIAADLYGCPTCGVEVVVGFASQPLAMHGTLGYANEVANLQAWSGPADKARAIRDAVNAASEVR